MADDEWTPRDITRGIILDGQDLRGAGMWERSNARLLEAIEYAGRELGADDADTLTARTVLAYHYRQEDRHKEAEVLDREVVSRRQATLGEGDAETAKSLNNLALDLKGQGRRQEALELEEKALQVMLRVEGEDSPSTMTSMSNLANSYMNNQQYEEARRYHQRVLDVRTRVLGRENSATIASMDLLGMDFTALGQFDKAVEIQKEAVQLATAALGPTNDTTIKCIINLSDTYECIAQNGEGPVSEHVALKTSIGLLEGALRDFRVPANEDNPVLIALMNNLGTQYTYAERLDEAKSLMISCFEWNEKKLGKDHPKTRISMQNLQYILEKKGDLVWAPIYEP